jgi:hypothetical protein
MKILKNDVPTIKRDFPYVYGKKYYYLGARSAWDTVEIGLFNTKEEALRHVPYGSNNSIVKVADGNRVAEFFGIKQL